MKKYMTTIISTYIYSDKIFCYFTVKSIMVLAVYHCINDLVNDNLLIVEFE